MPDVKSRRPLEEVIVAKVSEVPDGSMKRVTVAGRPYLLVQADGEFYALADRCPHQGTALSCGMLTGAMVPSAPGEFKFDLEGRVVECPWHRWKFSIETGESLFSVDRRNVQTFPARVEDDQVLIAIPARPKRGS